MVTGNIIDAVITQSGTDASRANILNILNERYFEQVSKSRWLTPSVTIATTVSGQSDYPLPNPPEIIEITGLTVGGVRWDRIGQQDMWELQTGSLTATVGASGLFAPDFDSTGQAFVSLYPPPQSGLAIVAVAACVPPILWDSMSPPPGGAFIPITPSDTHGSLIDGTTATVLRRIDERSDLAVPFETTFQAATEDLRKRKNSLLRGRGPVQIQVAGYHWDNR